MAAFDDLINAERLEDYDDALMTKLQGEFAAIADLPATVGDLPDGQQEASNGNSND